ncbi:hypothetical protein RB195_000312 [Necator americanus]|uniref:Uncharacterized protein n=1 Tax=Necator americanus TaxID=51031 RepID=A0ABR1D9U4_NECAM
MRLTYGDKDEVVKALIKFHPNLAGTTEKHRSSDESDNAETLAVIKFVNNLGCCLNLTIDKLQKRSSVIPHGLVDGRRSEDDLTSLKCLLKDENEIAAVKLIETDDPTGDGFALALVTTNGRKYLERYGHN